jgi:hypothetical protein
VKGKVHYTQHINLIGQISYSVAIICDDLFLQGYVDHNFDEISLMSGFDYEFVGDKKIKTATYHFTTDNRTDRLLLFRLLSLIKGHISIERDKQELLLRLKETQTHAD